MPLLDQTEYIIRFKKPAGTDWTELSGGGRPTAGEAMLALANYRRGYPEDYRWRVCKRHVTEVLVHNDPLA